jgi:hypothetical protein
MMRTMMIMMRARGDVAPELVISLLCFVPQWHAMTMMMVIVMMM